MRLQEYIIKNKEKILWAFCNIYGNDLYNKIANRFDQIEFLFPNLQPEDYNKCLDEICYHPNNVESIPEIEIIRKLKDSDECGFFIPLLRKGKNNDFTLHYFIIINSNLLNNSYENLDVVLFHELKHCLTYRVKIVESTSGNNIIYHKSGLSIIKNEDTRMTLYYKLMNEVLTQYDAENMVEYLHQFTEILPEQKQKVIPYIWYQIHYKFLHEYLKNQWENVRILEMSSNIEVMLQGEYAQLFNMIEQKMQHPLVDIRSQLIRKR